MKRETILNSLQELGYKYISKDSDGEIMAWSKRPILINGTHGGRSWRTDEGNGCAYSKYIDTLSDCLDCCDCVLISDIVNGKVL